MSLFEDAVAATVAIALAGVGLCAANLLILALLRMVAGRVPAPVLAGEAWHGKLPRVLVQLPVFNEKEVIERALAAAAALDWPADRLRIQVLDDSTDETVSRIAHAVARLRASGVDVMHVRRHVRLGFKAGALAHGMELDDSPFIAIFDADFVPPPDFLRRTVPMLMRAPRLAFVQARWGHLNAAEGALTRAQSLMIDAHFAVEQFVRARFGLLLPFNGTCAVWRRAAIDAAGGWSAETLCEDLDLAIRARLAGWQAVFRDDVVVPGELPGTLGAWRAQQFRWTKGFLQVAFQMLPRLWQSRLEPQAKLAVTLQLLQPLCYLLTVVPLLGTVLLLAWGDVPAWLSPLAGGVGAVALAASTLFMAVGQKVLQRGDWWRFPRRIVVVVVLNGGLVVSNSRAALEAMLGQRSAFVRTPKRGASVTAPRPLRSGPTGVTELIAAGAAGAALAYAAGWASPLFSVPIIGLLVMGAGLVSERMGWDVIGRDLARRLGFDQPAK